MLFLSWTKPSPLQQKACIDHSGGDFNYEPSYRGASATALSSSSLQQHLSKEGFFINEARILLGSGFQTFNIAKTALLTWKHFNLKWAFVDPKTPIQTGSKFCVCVKEFIPWMMMPLRVAYVIDQSRSSADHKLHKAFFGFGSGTLRGHLLAGEERFSVEMDENDQVWFEIFSFSKPAHVLSLIGYPYVQLRQKYFAQQSMKSILKHVNSLGGSM